MSLFAPVSSSASAPKFFTTSTATGLSRSAVRTAGRLTAERRDREQRPHETGHRQERARLLRMIRR